MDRDGKFCPAFRKILKDEGARPLLLPPRSPNLNAYIERFMRSLKSESLSRMIFFGERPYRCWLLSGFGLISSWLRPASGLRS